MNMRENGGETETETEEEGGERREGGLEREIKWPSMCGVICNISLLTARDRLNSPLGTPLFCQTSQYNLHCQALQAFLFLMWRKLWLELHLYSTSPALE